MGSEMSLQVQSDSMANKKVEFRVRAKALSLVFLMFVSSIAALEFAAYEASATTDQDGDGLTCGMEFLLQTQCQDWDSDNDGLPDGWEWKYGLNPNDGSSLTHNGASGDPDGDSFSNLQEYNYLMPLGWDSSSTANVLDNGVWWNGTVPVRNWNEEDAMQVNQPGCGDPGSDGNGSSVILCDEDPVGDICNDGIDNDKDGLVDMQDPDRDGDQVCGSDDDDGDGVADEDPDGWDTDGDGMPDGWEVSNGLNATNPNGDDGMMGDPDNDGLVNILEYINPSWTTSVFQSGNPQTEQATENVNPCNPLFGCLTQTASVDQDMDTDPLNNDTDGDGLEDGWEALVILTDPTSADTDGDGIDDGVEANFSTYGNPPQHSDPRNNNTDGDQFDDGAEDINGNGQVDAGETDPTRREDAGDYDNDGIDNWLENLSCTLWNVYDTDFGGVGDGDEQNLSHSTDPCMSLLDFSTTLDTSSQPGGYSSSQQRLYLTDATGFDPTPVDWRTLVAAVGYYNDTGGQLTSFTYTGVVNDVLLGVTVAPPVGTVEVISKNGSWCHYDGTQLGTLGSTHAHCDDDYEDTDGDGLANWEETLSIWGWFSIYTLWDSDGDGQSDLDEILNGTDPMEPCDNRLDSDGDLLNDYFENTTGCDLMYVPGMGGGNGSMDTYITDYLEIDTDHGGVPDSQEYLDGTNPQNDPSDDLNPADTDGDGIPDNIENQTGTDWRNPDTDGGGMSDYEECPPQFWQDCRMSPQNPWDPTDDISPNEVYFYANDTASTGGGADVNQIHRWRVRTYDYYTGGAYGTNTSTVIETQMTQGHRYTFWVANNTFWNSTETWQMDYLRGVNPGSQLPQPAYAVEYMMWVDTMAELNQSNYTHDIRVSQAGVMVLIADAPEIFYSQAELGQGLPFTSTSYGTELPSYFMESSLPESYVRDVTEGVITDSSAVTAWDKVEALRQYLAEEDTNTSDPDFKLNFDGSGVPIVEDITRFILQDAREGSCSEFVTVFTTMARIAGIPARVVTGYSGGTWHGSGYTIMGNDWSTWAEVHFEQSSTGLDMGWIPIYPCPPSEQVQVVNESVSPLTIERDLSTGSIFVNGTLQFSNNSTGASNALVHAYLVEENLTNPLTPTALTPDNDIRAVLTDSNGNFSINGTPFAMVAPGYAKIVVETRQGGYVPYSTHVYAVRLNITDDVNLSQDSPTPIGVPIVGAGTTTTITGTMLWDSDPRMDPSQKVNLSVHLTYPSSVTSQSVTISAPVWGGGFFSFDLNLSEQEAPGWRTAVIEFRGWHEGNLDQGASPVYHARPLNLTIQLNVTMAPNLTATLEGPDALNSSMLVIGENIYVNGTVVSRDPSPQPMSGYLTLLMRRSGSLSGHVNITVWNVTNGAFNISWNMNAGSVQVGPGPLDVILQFSQAVPGATDDNNLTGYGLRSEVSMDFNLGTTLRGDLTQVFVYFLDHTGGSDMPFNGTFTMTFNGTQVNATTNPENWYISFFTPAADMAAGDYWWNISYDGYLSGLAGSEWYKPGNASGLLRVQGTATLSINLANDWTHLGGSNTITGLITDDVLGTTILWNQTDVIFEVYLPGQGSGPMGEPPPPIIIPLGNSWSDPVNGTYSVNVILPNSLASAALNLTAQLDFASFAVGVGQYYVMYDSPPALIGLESELVLTSNRTAIIVEAGDTLEYNITVTDVGDGSGIQGETVNFTWDWGGGNVSIGPGVSGANGITSFNWPVPLDMAPGYYDVRVWMDNDTSDPLVNGATRWWGNETFLNITVQVPSNVSIATMPLNVTAGQSFVITGTVADGNNASRPFDGPIAVEVFFFNDTSEVLIASQATAVNGSFNLTVPTDPFGDGVTNGNKTVVVSILDGSNPFYLTGSAQRGILVIGVTDFESQMPLIPEVVTRGENITFGATLVEASDNYRLLTNTTVSAQFHDAWMPQGMTDVNGTVRFTYQVPNTQPLGQITVTLFYNGSYVMHPTIHSINTISVRSITFMVVDPIQANPIAGGTFNVTGSLVSDNGSGIISRDGTGLLPQVQLNIDGFSTTFSVSNAIAQADGSWTAVVTLSTDFPRGNHTLTTSYTPTVNYYLGSSGNNTFDSRGFSVLQISEPISLDPDYRTVRGDNVSIRVTLQDNTLAPIANATIIIEFASLNISTTVVTDPNGSAWALLNVPASTSPGPLLLNASYGGLAGPTGVLGDADSAYVVILAPTVITIDSVEGEFIAGKTIYVNGTLLDEWGQVLQESGLDKAGVLHLSVDGEDTGAYIETNATTGTYSMMYTLPEDTAAGAHLVTIIFRGGFMWVDPIGQGDATNPEYYLNSSVDQFVNVSVPTYIILSGGGGDIDREGQLMLDGNLYDIVDNPLVNQTLEVWFDNQWLTNVTSDDQGHFQIFYPVPQDSPLGPQSMEVRFAGTTFYLPSQTNTSWNVYSQINIALAIPTEIAINDDLVIQGTIRDNLPDGWINNHSIEVRIDGIPILGSPTYSDVDGVWVITWTVPGETSLGSHDIEIYAPAQGWYRDGSANGTFWVAHHSAILLVAEDNGQSTRGMFWNVSGRLYDSDALGLPGIDARSVDILLDGVFLDTVTTDQNGEFVLLVPIDMVSARGDHTLSAHFAGESSWLASNQTVTLTTWSDISWQLVDGGNTIIRSQSLHPIIIEGRILEVGGSGNPVENLDLVLYWNQTDLGISDRVIWTGDGNFRIELTAPQIMPAGDNILRLFAAENGSRFFNSGQTNISIFVVIPVDFETGVEIVPYQGDRVIAWVKATARDTELPVEDITVTAMLYNDSFELSRTLTGRTSANGSFWFEFVSVPPMAPYGDKATYGELWVQINSTDEKVAEDDRIRLETTIAVTILSASIVEEGKMAWIYGGVAAAILGLVVFAVYWRRRKQSALSELADIFAYTAELLAAGDEFREAIFNCYESLCAILMKHRFLRRDFETVREFEMAIRKALPINEESLVALDSVFEEARYSRHEMGEAHKSQAQEALARILNEIEVMQDIPIR